jgi:hypothetical protein
MTEYYTNHNMVQRIADLHSNHQKMSNDAVRSLLESWDRDQGRAMLHSERLCGSRSQRNHWSPDLRNAGLICRYWNLRFKEATTPTGDYTATILRLLQSAQQHTPSFQFPFINVSLSVSDILVNWKSSKQTLREAQATSRDLRFRSYSALLSTYEDDNDPITRPESLRRARILKNTMRTEAIRTKFRNIKLASTNPTANQSGGSEVS